MPNNKVYRANHTSGRRFYAKKHQSPSRRNKKDYIDPARFIQTAKPTEETTYTPQHSFADFAIDQLIMRNLRTMGFSTPSPIQDQTIPLGLAGKDVVGIANTGTGKTGAFAIPIINRLMSEPTARAIILAPTRELAEQIEQQCRAIGKGSRLRGALLIGGNSMRPQLRDLSHKPSLIIGTPGRIKDHLERGTLSLTDCNIIVLDEVDRMLDMGFVHDITQILSHTSPERQSFYFSATLDERVKRIIAKFSTDPIHISVKASETAEHIEQNIIKYDSTERKLAKLYELLQSEPVTKAIIFDDTQRSVDRLSKQLTDRGIQADAIHGGKSQPQRQRVLRKFKASHINVLVATDVAARGIDVSDISHVINFSLPQSYDDYVHRIGRTGRAGQTGHALTFVPESGH